MTVRLNWGTGLALVYTLFALGTVSVVVLAVTRPADLVSADYYERSLSFDAQIAAQARGRAAGVTMVVDGEGAGPVLRLVWPDGSTPVESGTVSLYRASAAARDRTFALALDGHGRQSIDLTGTAPGHWRAELTWTAGGERYYVEREVVTP